MSSAPLLALRNAIATNTLTSLQQGPLLEVLDLIAPIFPSPDEQATVGPVDVLVAREWTAALYAINAGGGDVPPPPGGITDVVGIPPIDVTVDGLGVATVSTTLTPGNDWPYDAPIAASVVAPRVSQASPAPSGTGQPIQIRTQDAAVGSGLDGGRVDLTVGARDGAGFTGAYVTVGCALAPGVATPFVTNYWNALSIASFPASGASIMTMGRGTNGVGLGTAGNEFSAFGPISIACELAAGGGPEAAIVVNPVVQFAGPQPAIKLAQDPDGSPYIAMFSSGSDGPAATGFVRVEYADDRPLLAQLANDGVTTINAVGRVGGEMYYGDYLLESIRFHAQKAMRFELNALDPDGGWRFASVLRIEFTDEKPIRHGLDSDANDGTRTRLLPFDTTDAGPDQAIAAISLVDGVSLVSVMIVANQLAGGDDYATFTMVNSFRKTAGVLAAATAPDVIVATGGAAAGVDPKFVVNVITNRVEVQVSPWTADDIHWEVIPLDAANTGLF